MSTAATASSTTGTSASSHTAGSSAAAARPCRVCSGFGEMYSRTAATPKSHADVTATSATASTATPPTPPPSPPAAAASPAQHASAPAPAPRAHAPGYRDCPEDYASLGRKSWAFLHTVAAYFPAKPTAQQSSQAQQLMHIVADLYPCRDCGDHLTHYLKDHPVEACTQSAFAQWMCRMHNDVNRRLGKPEFDCSKVEERWHRGWDDGSCD